MEAVENRPFLYNTPLTPLKRGDIFLIFFVEIVIF